MGSPDQSTISSLLADWRRIISERPANIPVDFSDSNRTKTCIRRVDAFLETPTPDSFRNLWCAEAMSDYWRPSAVTILDNPDVTIDALADLNRDVRDASAYDPAWETRLDGALDGFGLHELYGRLHADQEPIPTVEATRALSQLGYTDNSDPESVRDGIKAFKDQYEQELGRVTAGAETALPIYAEIDELFRVAEALDDETMHHLASGEYSDFVRPFLGASIEYDPSDPINWNSISGLLDEHLEARESGAYNDLSTEHWGGTHIESWKWQFKDYFQDVIKDRFELTDLDPNDIPAFFEAISDPADEFDVVQDIPRRMMGSRHHQFTWNDLVDHYLENPVEAAATLSDLFDEDLPIEHRLNQFYAFAMPLLDQGENTRSPGSLLRAVTTLLMYAYPNRHIAFQYQRTDEFFQEHTDIDSISMGYNSSQYREIMDACQRLRDELDQRTDEASMIDVQTLIYVNHDA